jgi:hypothetical protein
MVCAVHTHVQLFVSTVSYIIFSWVHHRISNIKKMELHNLKSNSHIPCRAQAVPLPWRAAKGLDCVLSHLIYTVRPCMIHTSHATTMPF